jgi:hypothetical protein
MNSVISPVCSHCGASDSRIVWSAGNLGRTLLISLMHLMSLGLVLWSGAGEDIADATDKMHLRRRCRRCRGLFVPGRPTSDSTRCGQCGYDLTGNSSGVCPECGWDVPLQMRNRPTE